MPADFHFLRPEWLWAVPPIVLAAWALARRSLGPGRWEQVVDPALAPHVLSGAAGRRGDGRWWLLGITGIVAAVALAGPAWQRVEQPVFRADQALVIALDLSRSMDAQDVSPSRMARARLKILDILERRASGQTALIVYSANAFTVTPLTTDTDTIAALVNSLSTDIMPSRGSYPPAAMTKGRALLDQAGVGAGEVLLVTDGGSSPAAERVARDLRAAGYRLSVLGVGTAQGAPIPKSTGGFVTDRAGRIAVPRLEEHSLRALAAAGGGRYATLAADTRDLDYLLSGEVGAREAGDDTLATDKWREEGPWLVLLLLPLAALAFRRGWVVVVVLAVSPLPLLSAGQAQASVWDDLWQTRDQQARQALAGGDATDAAALFENPEWQAVARYRAGDYAESAAQFAEQGDTRNLYNLGNALARLGEFESAIDAYETVLEMEPDHVDAAYNRDLLRQLQQQQQEQSQQQGEGDEQQSADQQGGEDSATESAQQGQDGNSESSSEAAESAQANEQQTSDEDMQALQEELERAAEQARRENQALQEQALSEEQLEALRRAQEQQQAMEQWLRRIPNDPGGLLRRKFRYQYQRMGKDQDGNNLWPDDEVQPW